jgi:hypothetical protein
VLLGPEDAAVALPDGSIAAFEVVLVREGGRLRSPQAWAQARDVLTAMGHIPGHDLTALMLLNADVTSESSKSHCAEEE